MCILIITKSNAFNLDIAKPWWGSPMLGQKWAKPEIVLKTRPPRWQCSGCLTLCYFQLDLKSKCSFLGENLLRRTKVGMTFRRIQLSTFLMIVAMSMMMACQQIPTRHIHTGHDDKGWECHIISIIHIWVISLGERHYGTCRPLKDEIEEAFEKT